MSLPLSLLLRLLLSGSSHVNRFVPRRTEDQESAAPYGATQGVRGVPRWRWARHADLATGAFGGAPYEATDAREGRAEWGAGAPCGPWRGGLQWRCLAGPRSV
eukprot:4410908-Pyramimonas_sp.AAC.1